MATMLKNELYSAAFHNHVTNMFGYEEPNGWYRHGYNLGISTIAWSSIGLVGHAIAVFRYGICFFVSFSAKHAISVLSVLALTRAGSNISDEVRVITCVAMLFVAIPATYGWGLVTIVTKTSFTAVTAGKIVVATVLPIITLCCC